MAFESNQMHLNQMQVQMQMSTIQMQMRPPRGSQMQVQMQMPHLHLQVQMHLHLNTSLVPSHIFYTKKHSSLVNIAIFPKMFISTCCLPNGVCHSWPGLPKVHSAIFVSAIVLISSSALLLGTVFSQAGDGLSSHLVWWWSIVASDLRFPRT